MATFSSLTADVDYMRQGNSDVFADWSDDDLLSLNKEIAKRKLKNDLMLSWGLKEAVSSDMEVLDTIVDKNEETLQVALSYLQLYFYFFEKQQGESSKTYMKMKEYQRMYDEYRMRFKGLYTDSGSATTIKFLERG